VSLSQSDITFVKELFSNIPNLTTRQMMGGLSIYSEGHIFAISSPEAVIYIKAKDQLQTDLCNQGARQFTNVTKDGKTRTMGYWTLPNEALDDPELACDWAKRALQDLS